MIVTFIVVKSFSPYTTILDRAWIHAMGVVPSMLHVKVKFHTKHGIATVREINKWQGSAWWLPLIER